MSLISPKLIGDQYKNPTNSDICKKGGCLTPLEAGQSFFDSPEYGFSTTKKLK
jgi:hypothetical protein